MKVFHFRARDSRSDCGVADVVIQAVDAKAAFDLLNKLRIEKKRTDLKFACVSQKPYSSGIVYENIEERIPDELGSKPCCEIPLGDSEPCMLGLDQIIEDKLVRDAFLSKEITIEASQLLMKINNPERRHGCLEAYKASKVPNAVRLIALDLIVSMEPRMKEVR